MKIVFMFEPGDKIVIKTEKEGSRWSDEGLMDKYLGQTLTVNKMRIHGTQVSYTCDESNNDDYRDWAWFQEMIDFDASRKLNEG